VDVNTLIQEIKFEAFIKWWEACEKSL
jgi:hypothetical protein